MATIYLGFSDSAVFRKQFGGKEDATACKPCEVAVDAAGLMENGFRAPAPWPSLALGPSSEPFSRLLTAFPVFGGCLDARTA